MNDASRIGVVLEMERARQTDQQAANTNSIVYFLWLIWHEHHSDLLPVITLMGITYSFDQIRR